MPSDDALQSMAANNPHTQPAPVAYPQPAPAPVPQPAPPFQQPPAGPGEQRSAPIWMSQEDHAARENKLRELTDFKREYDRIMELKEAERVKLMADKGQIEQALTELRSNYEKKIADTQQRASSIEQNWLRKETALVITDALAGREFVGDPQETSQMVRELLDREVEAVIGTDGAPYVRDRVTLRPAADYLRERLASPRFAIFFRAKSGGGSGTDGTRTDATPPTAPPMNLTPDQIVRGWQSSQQPIPAMGLHRKQA